ncbi:TNFAIP3-interacting protein 1 isoform X2 [Pleurodeles waltl]|uniref:TNFAIP3-interacting protein 1 isoform X2 n=1 Tax=Pleurodeles waltl TaxID=8319 RepID=UPI0037097C0C
MDGKGPYRIYDPGGARDTALERLVEENTALKERMKGIRSLGELLEESQVEASKLRQRVEDLVKENPVLESSSPSSAKHGTPEASLPAENDQLLGSFVLPDQDEKEQKQEPKRDQKSPGSGSSSEFEIVPADEKGSSRGSDKSEMESQTFLPNTDSNLILQLQRLETSLSEFSVEPDRNQLFTHLGRMALEFNRLATKVHKNEQRTSVLQTLCEQLRKENEELRKKLEEDLEQRNQASENLRVKNMEQKQKVTLGGKEGQTKVTAEASSEATASGDGVKLERVQQQQNGKLTENAMVKDVVGAMEKKVKALEHQRNELLEVNKQWDKHFRSMKQQYEQKITTLRQKLGDSQKLVADLEAEREHKQCDFERKLLLAKSKIETEEGEKKALEDEVKELLRKNRILQDQLSPVSRQREYQEKEIQRLNKALEEALNVQASAPPASMFSMSAEARGGLRREEQLTQIQLLKQQVKIFEEDFQRERSDRERMSEEKEGLKHEMEKLQTQITQQNAQSQVVAERLLPEHHPGALGPMYTPCQYPYTPPMPHAVYQGFDDWQIHFPPAALPAERPSVQDSRHLPPPEYPWWVPCRIARNLVPCAGDGSQGMTKDSDSSASVTPKNQHPI